MKKLFSLLLCVVLCSSLALSAFASENDEITPYIAVSICPSCGLNTYSTTGVQQVSWEGTPTGCDLNYDHLHIFLDEKQEFVCTTCGYKKTSYHFLDESCPKCHWGWITWYVHKYE